MKKCMYIILYYTLIIGCSSTMPCRQYFSKLSTEEIEDVDEKTLTFRTSYMDFMFKSLGTILEPNIPFEIKYDTLSHYTIIAGGNIIFSKEQKENVISIKNDTIELSYIIVKKEGVPAKRYSCKGYSKSVFNNTWKDCPIPLYIMKEIRKDFFIRMKYQKYKLICNDSLKGINIMHQYQLF